MNVNFVQLLGFVGILLNFIIFQQKDRNKLLLTKLCSDVVWGLHYFLLGAYSGSAIATVGIFRELVSYNKEKFKNKMWPVIFVFVGIGAALITQKGIFKIFPAAASALSVMCFWQNKTANSRLLALPISACMLTYSIYSNSTAGIVNETITIISVFIGYLIIDRKEKVRK